MKASWCDGSSVKWKESRVETRAVCAIAKSEGLDESGKNNSYMGRQVDVQL
jgi:hypothetical protein